MEAITHPKVHHALDAIAQLSKEAEMASADIKAKGCELRSQFPSLAVEHFLSVVLIADFGKKRCLNGVYRCPCVTVLGSECRHGVKGEHIAIKPAVLHGRHGECRPGVDVYIGRSGIDFVNWV